MSVPSKDEEDATEDEEAVRMLQFTGGTDSIAKPRNPATMF